MIRVYRIAAGAALTIGLLGSFARAGGASSSVEKKRAAVAQSPEKATGKSDVKSASEKKLSPEQIALRDRLRNVLAAHQKQNFNTRDHSATEILSRCLAFGCGTEVLLESSDGQQRINGITALCWNYPCGGFELLGLDRGHVAARIGYGCQERPGEFLAMLAASRVPPNYPVRLGKDVRSVADVIEAEKLACRSGVEMSLPLVGLAYYVDEPEWKNAQGETWSIRRIVEEEMTQPVLDAPEGGTNRLMGLSYAIARRVKRGGTLEKPFVRAKKYLGEFQDYALRLQSADGSWGPHFLAAQNAAAGDADRLRSNGRILEWLAYSLPEERLTDPHVVNAVDYVVSLLESQRYQWNAPSLTTREIVSLGHALRAVGIYDERVFRPSDVETSEPRTAEKQADG